jgi:hypothetical protein
MDLIEGFHHIADVTYTKRSCHRVEDAIATCQRFSSQLNRPDATLQAPLGDLLQALTQHREVQIRSQHPSPASKPSRKQQGQIAGTGADIDRATAVERGHSRRRKPFPSKVQPETQHRIVQIIKPRDGGEHPLDRLLSGLSRTLGKGVRF